MKMICLSIFLATLSIPPALMAKEGVEWGNGGDGFLPEVRPLELPFVNPLKVTPTICSYVFKDGLDIKSRFKKEGNSFCAYGRFSKKSLFGKKFEERWDCSDSRSAFAEKMEKELGMELKCQDGEAKIYQTLQDYQADHQDPTTKTSCDFKILNGAPVIYSTKLEDGKRTLTLYHTVSNRDYIWTERETHYRVLDISSELKDDISLTIKSSDKNFRLNLRTVYKDCSTNEVTEDKPGLDYYLTGPLIVKLSESDKASVQDLNEAIDRLPLKTLLGFKSYAEFVHYRVRNQELAKRVSEYRDSLNRVLTETKDLKWDIVSYSHYQAVKNMLDRVTTHIEERSDRAGDVACNESDTNIASPVDLEKITSYRGWATKQSVYDCQRMRSLTTKINDRLQRLQYSFPGKIPTYDKAGCRLIIDITTSLRDFNNDILIYDDFPDSFYDSGYAKTILSSLENLNQISYRKSQPGEFLEKILPNWEKVCAHESSQIREILNSFVIPE